MEEVYLIARYFYFKTAAGNAQRYFTGGTRPRWTGQWFLQLQGL